MEVILYKAKKPLKPGYTSVPCFNARQQLVGFVYVRAEAIDAGSLTRALDKAKPKRGEVVLNTVEMS